MRLSLNQVISQFMCTSIATYYTRMKQSEICTSICSGESCVPKVEDAKRKEIRLNCLTQIAQLHC
jgi:hypothetical protein